MSHYFPEDDMPDGEEVEVIEDDGEYDADYNREMSDRESVCEHNWSPN